MKVFVSQRHKDRTSEELASLSDTVVRKIREASGSEVIEVPMLLPEQFKGMHPVYYLGMNLQMMCQADLVVFERGWEESRACQVEHEVCDRYGLEYLELDCDPGKWNGDVHETCVH